MAAKRSLYFLITILSSIVIFNNPVPKVFAGPIEPLSIITPTLGQAFLVGNPITLTSQSIPPSPGNCEYRFDSPTPSVYLPLPEKTGTTTLGENHEIVLRDLSVADYHFTIRCPNLSTPDTSDFLTASSYFKVVSSLTVAPIEVPITGETPQALPAVSIVSPSSTQINIAAGIPIDVKTLVPFSCVYQIDSSGNDVYLTPNDPKLLHHGIVTGLSLGTHELLVTCSSTPSTHKTASLSFNVVSAIPGGPEIGSLGEGGGGATGSSSPEPSSSKTCSLDTNSSTSAYQGLFLIISALGLWFYRKRELK